MRLVDVDELKKQMCNECFGGKCEYRCYEWTLMNNAPTVDPIKHGQWKRTDAYPHKVYCSECYATLVPNDEWLELYKLSSNYCPNCGAKMDEVKDETD